MEQYEMQKKLVIIRGGGDLATGVIQKFYRAGFRLLVLEVAKPTAIRRTVSLCEAVYDGDCTVEDVTCRLVQNLAQIEACWQSQKPGKGEIPLIVDPSGDYIARLKPDCVIDAIIAKKNIGTHKGMAPITLALGPGFTAGKDVDAVIETMRGHNLGRLILEGTAAANTGIPGEIGGRGKERVVHAPAAGIVELKTAIGQVVSAGQVLLTVGGVDAPAPFSGLVRGLIRDGSSVPNGMKIADIDPRTDVDWNTISDKARCLGGAALEAFFYFSQRI